MGWVERWGLSCQNALNCTLPSTINSCNLHLNELDSVNLALPCLSGLKAMGPPSSPSSPGGPAPAGGDRETGSGRRGWWATGSEGARGEAGETPWVMATGAVKWTGCRQPGPQSQVSPCPGALSCMGGRSDAHWVGTHSQPHSLRVTSHPSPTATIPCPHPSPSQPPGHPPRPNPSCALGLVSPHSAG